MNDFEYRHLFITTNSIKKIVNVYYRECIPGDQIYFGIIDKFFIIEATW